MKSALKISALGIAVIALATIAISAQSGVAEANSSELVYNDFDDGTPGTNIGGSAGVMSPKGEFNPDLSFVSDSASGAKALSINYDFPSSDNWCGYWSYFNADESGYDISNYDQIEFWTKGTAGNEQFKIELKSGSTEVSTYSVSVPSTSYEEVVIPLSDFEGTGWSGYSPVDLTSVKQVNIVFDKEPTNSTVYIDEIKFAPSVTNSPPVADISTTPSPASGTAPLTVNFDASGSTDSDGSVQSYYWDFGDETSGTGKTISHEYSAGSYTATLTVTDNGGKNDTANVSVNATTGNETIVSVSPSTQEVTKGNDFTVEVEVNPATEIAGVQFDLNFDPSLVAVSSVEEGNLLSQNGANTYFQVMGGIDNQNGKVTGVAGMIQGNENVSSSGTFAKINMTAKEVQNEGTSLLNLENVMVTAPDGNSVPIAVNDGSVDVSVYPDGDINEDGSVNIGDMTVIGQHWGETGSDHWIRADANRNGEIGVGDMTVIGQNWTG